MAHIPRELTAEITRRMETLGSGADAQREAERLTHIISDVYNSDETEPISAKLRQDPVILAILEKDRALRAPSKAELAALEMRKLREEQILREAEEARQRHMDAEASRPFMQKVWRAIKGPERRSGYSKYGTNTTMLVGSERLEDRDLLSGGALGVVAETVIPPAPVTTPAAEWNDSTVSGWDAEEAPTNTSYMHDSAMSPSGKYMVATFQDGSIEVRNGMTGDVERTLNTGGGRAYYVSIDQHDMAYVSAGTGQNGRIMAIDLTNGVHRWTAVVGDNPGRSTASADGLQLVVDVDNKGSLILDTLNGNKLGGSSADGYGGTSVGTDKLTFFKAGSQLWLHEANGTERQLTTLDGLTYDTAATKDGTTVAVGGKGGVIALIDLDSGKETRLCGDTHDVLGLTFLDDHTLAVSHQGGMIDVWDTKNGSTTPSKSFSAGADWVWSMDASEGTLVVRAGGNNPVWRAVHLVDTSPPPTLSPETPPYQQIPNLYDIATTMAIHMTSPEAAVIPAPPPETPVDQSLARAEFLDRVEALYVENGRLGTELTSAEAVAKTTQERVTNITAALEDAKGRLTDARATLSEAEAVLATRTSALASARSTETADIATRDEAVRALTEAKNVLDAAINDVTAAQQKVDQWSASKKLYESLSAELAASKASLTQASTTLIQARNTYSAKKTEANLSLVNQAQTAYNTASKSYNDLAKKLNPQITAAKSQMTKDAANLSAALSEQATAIANLSTATRSRDGAASRVEEWNVRVSASTLAREQAEALAAQAANAVRGASTALTFAQETVTLTDRELGLAQEEYSAAQENVERAGVLLRESGDALTSLLLQMPEAPEAAVQAMSMRVSQEKVLAPMSARYEALQGSTGFGTLRLTSPFDASFVDTPAGLLRFDHAGGANDIVILKRNIAEWLRSQNGSQPEVTFTVYADAEKTLPIYEMIFVSDGAGGVSLFSAHALAISASDLPAGVESAGRPATFEVADVSGPGIILAVDPGWVGTGTVQFHGLHDNGVFTGTTVTGKEGGGITPVSLSINGSNPTGDYAIMLTGPDGAVSARIRVHWDQATKQLSLLDGRTVWTAGEADQGAMSQACAELHALKNDPASGDRLLGSLQQAVLLEGLHDLPASYAGWLPGADAAYWKTHPDSTDDALRIKAQTGPGNFTPTQAFEALVRTRTDEMRLLRQAYGQYESAMGQLLQQGVSVLAQIRAGGDEFQLRRDFSLLVNQASGSLTMQQLAGIGIQMPTGDQMLEAAKLIWGNQWQEQLELKAGEAQLAAQDALQSQLAARGDFVQNNDGTWMAQNDPRLQQVTYYVDAQGRVTTLASNQVAASNGSVTNTAYQTIGVDFAGLPPNEGIHSAASIEGVWTYDLELQNGEFIGIKNYAVNANKSTEITFTLTQDTMVNFGVPGAALRDVNLTITGDGLPANGYSTPHGTGSGDSVSLKLTAGSYTLVIKDASNYYMRTPTNFAVPVQMDIQQYNSAKITGMISIEGNASVMPVSMKMASFDAAGSRIEFDPVTKEPLTLSPNKPVWVVIHGRGDQWDSGKITELEKALFESGYQVVSINWKEAAGSNIPESAGMQGEAWIQSVADWSYRALKSAGIEGEQLKVGGHSWGSFVGFEIAEHFKAENGFGIDTFVALDSAQDPTLSFRYDASQVNFGAVSKSSTAFWSSLWGNEGRATTALHTVDLRSPRASLYPLENQTLKHGLAVTTFANLIRLQNIDPSNDLAKQFSFTGAQLSMLPSQERTDAWLFVESFLKTGASPNDEYIDAIPTKMTFTNPDDGSVDSYLFNTLNNVQSTINAY